MHYRMNPDKPIDFKQLFEGAAEITIAKLIEQEGGKDTKIISEKVNPTTVSVYPVPVLTNPLQYSKGVSPTWDVELIGRYTDKNKKVYKVVDLGSRWSLVLERNKFFMVLAKKDS